MVGEMQEECKVGKKQSVFKETVAVPKSQSLIPYRKRKKTGCQNIICEKENPACFLAI